MPRLLLTALLLSLLLVAAPLRALPPPLMLAGQWRGATDVSRYLVSEKLDGVRARWDGRHLWSRAGHRIRTPDGFTDGWPAQALDGELWMGRGRFEVFLPCERNAHSVLPRRPSSAAIQTRKRPRRSSWPEARSWTPTGT